MNTDNCRCGAAFVRTEYQSDLHCPVCGERPSEGGPAMRTFLEALEASLQGVSPRPWRVMGIPDQHSWLMSVESRTTILPQPRDTTMADRQRAARDGRLITLLRNSGPEILAVLDAARAVMDLELQRALEALDATVAE